MKIHLFLGLIATASIIFNKVSAQSPINKSECKYAMKHGGIFNGQDYITLFEFIKNIETVAGDKLNANQIKAAKMDFERDDKNANGLLDVQEMIDQKLDKPEHLRMFELFDKNQDGFLNISEIRSFTLGLLGNSLDYLKTVITENFLERELRNKYLGPDNQMDFEEYFKWEAGSKTQCFS